MRLVSGTILTYQTLVAVLQFCCFICFAVNRILLINQVGNYLKWRLEAV